MTQRSTALRWFVRSFVCRRSLSFVRFRSFTFVRSLSFVHFRSFVCSSVTFLPSSESIYQRWCGVVRCGLLCCAGFSLCDRLGRGWGDVATGVAGFCPLFCALLCWRSLCWHRHQQRHRPSTESMVGRNKITIAMRVGNGALGAAAVYSLGSSRN